MSNITRIALRVARHLTNNGPDDVFIAPLFADGIENLVLKDREFKRILYRCARNSLHTHKLWNIGTSYKFPVSKNLYSYRNVDWIDFSDLAHFTALVLQVAPLIEAGRVPPDEHVVFSYRYKNFGHLFDRNYNYSLFKRRSTEIGKDERYKVKVSTDIANFYDRLNLHRLESTLADCGCDRSFVTCINEVLTFWANRNSYGLPVGSDASRILAEAALIPIDRALRRRGVRYIRFVDDFRIFAESFSQAHAHLNFLIEELNKEALFINTSKTFFIDLREVTKQEEDDSDTVIKMHHFDQIDASAKIEDHKIVQVGYAIRRLKYYRYPGQEQIKYYKSLDLSIVKNQVMSAIPAKVDDEIRLFVKVFIYTETKSFEDLHAVLDRFLHCIIYVVDAFIKESGQFSLEHRARIAKMFRKMSEDHERSPYYELAIVRLLCNEGYADLEFMRSKVLTLPVTTNPIFLRDVILKLTNIADRQTILEIRSMFNGVSLPVKRAIFYAVVTSEKMLDSEKKAWCKQMVKSESDDYIRRIAGRALDNKPIVRS